jgi:hypothetical protein
MGRTGILAGFWLACASMYLPWAETSQLGRVRGYQAPTVLYLVPLLYPFTVAVFRWRLVKWLALICMVLSGSRAAFNVFKLEAGAGRTFPGLYVFLVACVVMITAIPQYRRPL